MDSLQRSRTEPNVFARELFQGLPARYDLLAEVLSFGQNHRWQRAMVDAVLRMNGSSGRVLDVAAGTAGVSLMLTDRSDVTTTGIDVSAEMLLRGQRRVSRRERDNRIRLVLGRAEQLPFPDDSFDALTFTYLLRYVADPAATLQELFRVVRPGGAVASLEFLVPSNPVWKAGWIGYTRAVLPVAGFVTGGREGRGGPFPRAFDQRALSPLPRRVDGRGLESGRGRGRDRTPDEPGRRAGDVGKEIR